MLSLVVSLPQCQQVTATVTALHVLVEMDVDVSLGLVAAQAAAVDA